MNDLFTPVTTMDGSVYLRAVGHADGSNPVNFLMPISSFTNAQGQSVLPAGFGDKYSLYLTIDGNSQINPTTGLVEKFTSLNVTLWADPNSNDGIPSVDFNNNPSFSHGQNNDIALATGTIVSGRNFLDADGMTRHAILVETLNPTLAGTILLDGSIKPGSQIQEFTTTPASTFTTQANAFGGTTGNIIDGSVEITVSTPNPSDPSNPTPDTILLPNIPDLTNNVLGFIHHAKAIG